MSEVKLSRRIWDMHFSVCVCVYACRGSVVVNENEQEAEGIDRPCAVGLVAQSCSPLCDPMDSSPPGSSVRGDSPGKNTGEGCHALLQGIFPAQGSNPGLSRCKWILDHLSHHNY